ncbi:MAG: BamA/TamA family outer membrane protein [Trichodesmium sp. MAG_R01]|nr:BamA/TamA family outer membrane protein [Trichodesmium sp. MAG_R01]
MWIVRDSNYMCLYPFLVAIFAALTTFGISKSANAQIFGSSVDTDLVFISVNSKTQFAKLFSTKSFLDLGSSFPSQKLFVSRNNLLSKSWSETEIKLEFDNLLKVKEITKSSSIYKKELANFWDLYVLENLENPQLILTNKSTKTKSESLVNKQFSVSISNLEMFNNRNQNFQNVVLSKSTETKSEPLINKQFTATIPQGKIVEKESQDSQNVVLSKSTETKSEPLVNKQFIANIPQGKIVEKESQDSQNMVLSKSTETKSEPLVNKQFIATILQGKIVEKESQDSQNVVLSKSTETKSEPLVNKQFTANIPTTEIVTESEKYISPQSQQAQTSTEEEEPLVLVAEVVVTGVDGELQDEVYRVINTQPGETTTRSQLQKDINAIFATGFFQNVKAIPEDTPLGVRIIFKVEPNPILTSVIIEGAEVFPESETKRIFNEQYGETLNLKVFEQGVEQVDQWYQDNGYVLGQVIGAPQVGDDGTVTLEVAEGKIKDIQVRFLNSEGETVDEEGNVIKGRTREYIITREIELKTGDIFQRQTAEKDIRRVFDLGIFEDVRLGLEPAPDDPNTAVIVVNIVEKSTGSLAFGGGVSSASGLFGTVSYQQQNIGGNNQKLGGEFQVGERLVLADVSFTDPWIGGDDHRLSYTVNAFRRRTISVIFDSDDDDQRDVDLPNGDNPRVIRTGGGVSFTRPFIPNPFVDPDWTASLGLKYERVEIQDRDGEVEPRDELGNKLTVDDSGKDDLFTIQFGIVNDRRNNPRQPTSGSLLRFGAEQSIPVGSGEIGLNRLRGNFSYFIPVSFINFTDGPQALAFNIQAGHIIGDLPPYEAFALGGTNTVRGYDEGSVAAGRTFVLGTVEYRFPVFKFLGGALFVDAATVFDSQRSVIGNPGGVREKPGDGIGYGGGLRVNSPLGPIRIDYAINDEGDTRFHFGIGERF